MRFEDKVPRVMEAIAAYLAAHPMAKDTRAGIRAWWLPKEYRSVTDEVLDAALKRLAEAGVVKFGPLRGAPARADGGVLISAPGEASVSKRS